jgi:hypothetical protein
MRKLSLNEAAIPGFTSGNAEAVAVPNVSSLPEQRNRPALMPNGRLVLGPASRREDRETAAFKELNIKQESWAAWGESLRAVDSFESKRPRREAFLILSRTRNSERFDGSGTTG